MLPRAAFFEKIQNSFGTSNVLTPDRTIDAVSLFSIVQTKQSTFEKYSGCFVSVSFEQSVDYLTTVLALMKVGATPVLLPKNSSVDIDFSLAVQVGCLFSLSCKGEELKQHESEITPHEDDALVVMTSGSSGARKGVVLTYDNLYWSAIGSIQVHRLVENDCYHLALPLFHVSGIMVVFRMFLVGGDISLLPFEKDEVSSVISLVPSQIRSIIEQKDSLTKLKRYRGILLGGGGCSSALLHKMKTFELPVAKSFGMSEMSATITSESFGSHSKNLGKLLPFRDLTINDSGLVTVSGKTLAAAYLFEGKRERIQSSLVTSDLGAWNGKSFLHKGRKDLCFQVGEENYNPLLIEQELKDIMKLEQVVIVSVPDERLGAIPVAFTSPYVEVSQLTLNSWSSFFLPRKTYEFSSEGIKPDRDHLSQLAKRFLYES